MWRRVSRAIRYRLGYHVVSPLLERGDDAGVRAYYNSRVSECSFLAEAGHYERPRVDWILDRVHGGSVLEVGCADGTVTAMLASQVDHVTAVDICAESIGLVADRRLANVTTCCELIERFRPQHSFDWIVISEVLEHLRDPELAIRRCLAWLNPAGSLLLSTPLGKWEGDAIEHLHVFTFESWCAMLCGSGCRHFEVFTIDDHARRARWLGAVAHRGPA